MSSLQPASDPLIARFAMAVDAFGSPAGWWNRLLGDAGERLNLKKEGIFPLVQTRQTPFIIWHFPDFAWRKRADCHLPIIKLAWLVLIMLHNNILECAS